MPPTPPDNNNPPASDSPVENALEKAVTGLANIFGRVSDNNNADDTQPPPARPQGGREFFAAVKKNDITAVTRMLDSGIDPDSMNDSGLRALHLAARLDAAAMVALLLEKGANPRLGKKGDANATPLAEAVNFGKADAAALLSTAGGEVAGVFGDGWTALHKACEMGKTRVAEALLQAGVRGDVKTANGTTPLLVALARVQPQTASLLLEHPLVVAEINSAYTASDQLKRNAMLRAAELGQQKLLQKMIDAGGNVNAADADGKTLIHYAIERGDALLVRMLAAAGADLNRDNPFGAPLVFTMAEDIPHDAKAAIAAVLLDMGADPDMKHPATGRTALMEAVAASDGLDAARVILAHKPYLEAEDNNGDTALTLSLSRKSNALCLDLLAAGADPDHAHAADLSTPLMLATLNRDAQAVEAILRAGANPAACDAQHKSALFHARAINHNDIIKLLEDALVHIFPVKKPSSGATPKPLGF